MRRIEGRQDFIQFNVNTIEGARGGATTALFKSNGGFISPTLIDNSYGNRGGGVGSIAFDNALVTPTASENRPINTAFHLRLVAY